MELTPYAPHDLLRLRSTHDLFSAAPLPAWVSAALERAPLVVVRRSRSSEGHVAVGIRGRVRAERAAAELPITAVVEHITPEQLARTRAWQASPRYNDCSAYWALEQLAEYLDATGLAWGPTGSVGFELASGVPTTTSASDLDLLVRAAERLPFHIVVEQLHAKLAALPGQVDVQVETPYGAIALNEYVLGVPRVLLRTMDGPRLVSDPWTSPDIEKD